MDTRDAFRMALDALWTNKLRTVLTLLGVVIGVASVIAVVTLVNGANVYVASKFNRYGADTYTISKQPSFMTSYQEYLRYQKRKNVTLDEYRYVQENCGHCQKVGAMQGATGKVVYKTQSTTDSTIRGYTSLMASMQNLDIVEGRDLTQSDEDHASRVAIIGQDIEDNVLRGEDPLGKEIRVDGVPYTVVGLAEKQGSTLGQSQDNFVAVPLTAYQKTYGTAKTLTIYVKAGNAPGAMETVGDELRVLMRGIRHDRPDELDSFNLDTSDTLAGFFSQITNSFGAVAVAIAAISLVVGGIVIMNIMLVSVTERTREIGVRKALGARRGDILKQFLMESATMAFVGGLIGVATGIAGAKGITYLIDFPSTIALWSVFVGLGVAISIGIFFGVYPARKAADLDPIVALRSEF
ncbi:ABC transporter permease [Granulicella cerasi]|uniref:ABC transporter permease n=1 Tax=Granulicella cerasi TaxID=741063 RepID=A0ABW1ZBF5_9BACT|nr:ABC transporter permease [Granulicella cerasi]